MVISRKSRILFIPDFVMQPLRRKFPNAKFGFIFFLFFLSFLQLSWADKVYLKNGNVLEGSIIEESQQSILLDFSLESGSGSTEILKGDISSVEKGPAKVFKNHPAIQSKEQKPPEAKKENLKELVKEARTKTILVTVLVLLALFTFSFASIFVLSKILKTEFSRPLGIKILSFLMNTLGIIVGLSALMLISFAANKVFIKLEGAQLVIFLVLCIGVPMAYFMLVFGLFLMRKWARISLIVLLSMGIFGDITFLASGKKLEFSAQALRSFSKNAPETSASFDSRQALICLSVWLLWLLYLFRKETSEAFVEAGKHKIFSSFNAGRLVFYFALVAVGLFLADAAYKYSLIKSFHNPRLFTSPVRAKENIKPDESVLDSLAQYKALDYLVYLPSGMERMRSPVSTAGQEVTTFIERKKGIVFSISKLKEDEYRMYIASLYARWNPAFVLAKPPSSGERDFPSREVKFAGKEGVLFKAADSGRHTYRFILKTEKADYLDCLFVAGEADSSFDENKILNIVAAI